MSVTDWILKLVQTKCSSCSHQFTGEDLKRAESQIKAGVLVCPKCQVLVKSGAFGIGNQFHHGPAFDKSSLGLSSKIAHTLGYDGSINFEIPWRNSGTTFFFFFGFFWCSIVSFILYATVQADRIKVNGVYTSDKTQVYVFLSVFVVIGIATLGAGILGFINKTYLVVNRSHLSYTHGPLWLSDVKFFKTQDIANLSTRRSKSGEVNKRPVYTHVVDINLKDGTAVKLCRVSTPNDAVFIEKQVEKFLGIKDNESLDQPWAS